MNIIKNVEVNQISTLIGVLPPIIVNNVYKFNISSSWYLANKAENASITHRNWKVIVNDK